MEASVERITPAVAAKMLEKNTENFRSLDGSTVAAIARILRQGAWELDGQAIKFGPGKNGEEVLKDGQHRLHAVVRSGVSIESLVVRGSKCSGLSLDRGKPRTVGQWLRHHGMRDANNMATTARWCVAYDKNLWTYHSVPLKEVADHEVVDFAKEHQVRLYQCIRRASTAKKVLQCSILAPLLFVGSRGMSVDHEVILWFVQGLASGEDLSSTDAVYHLRERLMGQRPGRVLSTVMKRALATIAWNKTVLGEECSVLRVRLTGPAKQELPRKIIELRSVFEAE